MAAPIHGLLSWRQYDLRIAVPTPAWAVDLEAFTGLTFVPTPRPIHGPMLEVLDDCTVAVDGVAWEPFSCNADLRAWLYLTVSDVMIMRGELTVLHAAAFCHDSKVMLLCGGEWSGKSTMTLAALNAGYEVLGDDQVLLAPESEGVYALPRPVKCRMGTTGVPQGLPGDAVQAKLGEEAVALLPRKSKGHAGCNSCYPLGSLIHLRRHPGPGVQITQPARFEGLQQVLNQTRCYSRRDPLVHAARQANRLTRLPTYRVSVGDYETERALALITALRTGNESTDSE